MDRLIYLFTLFFCFTFSIHALDITKIPWDRHHNNSEVTSILQAIHQTCPAISAVYQLRYVDDEGHVTDATKFGNRLNAIQFSQKSGVCSTGKPLFKYVGNMHGNEVVGRELLLRLAVDMCLGYNNGNSLAKRLIDHSCIHILPTMNPDGWQIAGNPSVKGDKNQLKGRANGNDKDLNRDFPDLDRTVYQMERIGGPQDHLMSEHRMKCGERQPETCMVMEWILNNNFILSANLHGGDLVANYPYDKSRPNSRSDPYSATPDDTLFRELAETYSSGNPVMHNREIACPDAGKNKPNPFDDGITNGAEWYSVASGMQDFNYLATNCFEITLELGCTKYPDGDQLPRFWKDNRVALVNYILAVHFGIKGQITSNGKPVKDDAVVEVFDVSDGKSVTGIAHNIRTGKDGFYYRLLVDGAYLVLAKHKGCSPVLKCVRINNSDNLLKNSARIVNFDLKSGDEKSVQLDADSCTGFPGIETILEGPINELDY